MAIVAAGNNGGRYNKVHRQTDDGIVFSIAAGDSLVPITFRYSDYLGDMHETLISSGQYPHDHLMRGDCGLRRKDDSDAILFSWSEMERVLDTPSDAPSGEYVPNYHEVANEAKDVLIDGIKGHRTTYYRKDREYWTPDTVLQADSVEDLFGWTQFNPASCEPRKPNKCGLINFEEKC